MEHPLCCRTVKFFPIFFLREVGLPPVAVNCIVAGTPLCLSAFSFLCAPVATLIGAQQHALHPRDCGAIQSAASSIPIVL